MRTRLLKPKNRYVLIETALNFISEIKKITAILIWQGKKNCEFCISGKKAPSPELTERICS